MIQTHTFNVIVIFFIARLCVVMLHTAISLSIIARIIINIIIIINTIARTTKFAMNDIIIIVHLFSTAVLVIITQFCTLASVLSPFIVHIIICLNYNH